MYRVDPGTRHLPPAIVSDPDEIVGPEMALAGSFVDAPALAPPAAVSATQPAGDLLEQDTDWEVSPMTIKGPASSIVSHGTQTLGGGAEWPHFMPESFTPPKPPVLAHRDVASEPAHPEEGQDGRAGFESDDASRPHDADGVPSEIDDVDSINVTQVALVDQDASIIVNGYVGDVVTRLLVDQDLMMDQNADIGFTIDGDGHFIVLIDQDMRIDQDVQIDVDMFDVDGVLYVDILLRDTIEIEQDTAIDVRITDGPPGGTVDVNQSIVMDQDVDIDIDIEDELEERYVVDVDVLVSQTIDADQDAVVDIKDWNGEIDMDLDAIQAATVDQQTIVQADLVLI
ncbi:hypothetical protein [Mesorhizobium sp. LjNodule214]|uniref:hypothetical protein n=1 Tax=Mesorhizobium sp. LjNodule214 TaxID=3342252 RepID=UPI003ECCB9FE